ncbi:MAG: DUF4143 domain-containing protein [Gammaproteobacteria bacterium]|nr:DUF4143 domain-containing protein [Gammaproteobacteria bacterium]
MAVVKSGYRPRLVDAELRARLKAAAAVLIEGPKACGKTSTARECAASEVFLDLNASARQAVAVDPETVLKGDKPRLLDEWQVAPAIWNHVRRAADFGQGMGRFILTGSAVPADDLARHTGAGRIARLRMRTMSLFEQARSTGEVSLGDLLAGRKVSASDPGLTLPDLIECICRGGWPGMLDSDLDDAMRFVRDYVEEVRRTDIQRAAGTRHDPKGVLRLIRSLARNMSTTVSAATLARDVSGSEGNVMQGTIAAYLGALERLFVVDNQQPFAPHLRSRSRLQKAVKRHFVDPSLAVAALRSSPGQLRGDLECLGLLFESLVVRDLRIYAAVHDAEVSHYKDNTGLEVDAVIETAAGQWLPVEVKLGGSQWIDAAAASLIRLSKRVDTAKIGAPRKLLVITATGYAYERNDGVSVVPLGALGP